MRGSGFLKCARQEKVGVSIKLAKAVSCQRMGISIEQLLRRPVLWVWVLSWVSVSMAAGLGCSACLTYFIRISTAFVICSARGCTFMISQTYFMLANAVSKTQIIRIPVVCFHNHTN